MQLHVIQSRQGLRLPLRASPQVTPGIEQLGGMQERSELGVCKMCLEKADTRVIVNSLQHVCEQRAIHRLSGGWSDIWIQWEL